MDTQEVTVNGKKKKVRTLKPIATAVAEWKSSLTPDPSPTGEGSGSQNQGGSSNTGGDNGGGDNGGGSAGFETGN